jgi:hypothetical protein
MFFRPSFARLQDHRSRRSEGRKSDVVRNYADFAERNSSLSRGRQAVTEDCLTTASALSGAMVNRYTYYSGASSGGSDERDGLLGSTPELGCPRRI